MKTLHHILGMMGNSGASGASQSPMGQYLTYAMWGGFAVIAYFFMIRPQQKKTAAQKEFRSSIEVGSNVVMISGLHGKVKTMDDNTVLIVTEGGNQMRFERSAISPENTQALQKRMASSEKAVS